MPAVEPSMGGKNPRFPATGYLHAMSILKTEPKTVEIGGQIFKCLICGNDTFHRRKSHLDTALVETMTNHWTNASAFCLVCDRCGHLEWFLQK